MKLYKMIGISLLAGMLILNGCTKNEAEENATENSTGTGTETTDNATANTGDTTTEQPGEPPSGEAPPDAPDGQGPGGGQPNGEPGSPPSGDGESMTGTADKTAVNEKGEGLTQQVTQGPYYVTGTSALTSGKLNYDNLDGDPIKVKGYVYAGETGTTPIAGAKIEIWQADTTGNYHPNSNGAASSYGTDEISLRGYVITDDKGCYEYTTIYPGEYEGRTRHIHSNTTADGYTGVITQLIIPSKTDDKMTADEDTIAQALPIYNQVKFQDENGTPTTTFIYRLAKAS
ncbi:protocatechuate 3,4-dioxygenase beta subunit [Paenibacillus phyllosphaerae]|uniref:Protocatechuate 3,4-dioxygenase beta subunit n=1 Tax=Paenibacillus phyllosphaerae TaxID=274593 RepID=A0A7W5AZN3_9BACL|nr:hypothetical protein [Paenibacillus phyllosphaerae]MBB3111587.1 protocatechuate 3,4-dioxygenase beta subunit [Paenibacillus phyllosphaerae]